MEKYIIKADGKKEPYNKGKISSSFKKAGASPEIAAEATKTINNKIKHNMSTDEIYHKALEHLKTMEPGVALKYSLKRAIMNIKVLIETEPLISIREIMYGEMMKMKEYASGEVSIDLDYFIKLLDHSKSSIRELGIFFLEELGDERIIEPFFEMIDKFHVDNG